MTNEEKKKIYDQWCEYQRSKSYPIPEGSYLTYTDQVYTSWIRVLSDSAYESLAACIVHQRISSYSAYDGYVDTIPLTVKAGETGIEVQFDVNGDCTIKDTQTSHTEKSINGSFLSSALKNFISDKSLTTSRLRITSNFLGFDVLSWISLVEVLEGMKSGEINVKGTVIKFKNLGDRILVEDMSGTETTIIGDNPRLGLIDYMTRRCKFCSIPGNDISSLGIAHEFFDANTRGPWIKTLFNGCDLEFTLVPNGYKMFIKCELLQREACYTEVNTPQELAIAIDNFLYGRR